jgi:hypothetical protein
LLATDITMTLSATPDPMASALLPFEEPGVLPLRTRAL